MPQLPVVAAGFSLRKTTQPKGCGYQFPPITDRLVIRQAFVEKVSQLLPDLSSPLLITNFDGQNENYRMFTLQTDHVAPSFLLILPSGKIYAFVSPIETSLLSALKDKIEIVAYASSSEIIPLIKKMIGQLPVVAAGFSLRDKLVVIPSEARNLTLLAEYSDDYNFDIIKYSWLKKLKKEFSLKPARDVIFPLRTIKTPSEINLIQQSVTAAFEILGKVQKKIKAGVTEMDIYNLIYFETRKKNAENSFKSIIASGSRAINPHPVRATDKKLKNGELLIIDIGVSFYGYTSDITRTFLVGGDIREHRFYKISREMFTEMESIGLSKIYPFELAQKMKVISKKYKVDIYEKHAYGHGIGTAVHDVYSISTRRIDTKENKNPPLSPFKKGGLKGDFLMKFQDGMAFAFEPGFYTKKIGFRWENNYFVKDGRAVRFSE
ncbi:MAG: M24 family metallopeptidase [bacterium]